MRFVPLYLLKENEILAESIVNIRNQVLLQKDSVLTEKNIKRIRSLGIQSVYVKDPEIEDLLQEEVKDIIRPNIRKNAVFHAKNSIDEFYESLRKHTKLTKKSAYSDIGSELKNNLTVIATDLIDEVMNTDDLKISLMDIKSEEFYRYEHSVNSAVLSIMIGTKLGLKTDDLKELALGALMMDIGFNDISKSIYEHKKDLSKSQREMVIKHPVFSYKHVTENTTFGAHVKSIILQHHERIDGSGYPLGIGNDKINRLAKIVMVADVYDAMTSDRTFRAAYPHNEVIEYIMGNAGTIFDFEVASALCKNVTPYPVGAYVKLSNSQKGVVLKNSDTHPLRPLIRTFGICDYKNCETFQVDLMDVRNITVEKIIYELVN